MSGDHPHVHCCCGEENNKKTDIPIPEEFKNIIYKEEQHQKWEEMIQSKCSMESKEDEVLKKD